MSIGQCDTTGPGPPQEVPVPSTDAKPLQRVAQVRRLQGVSRRTIARRMNVEIEQVRQQEQATTDLTLSMLYAWQKALDVPVGELLVEAGDALASPILERSQLVRFMKTVLAIRQQARQESIRRMAETMAGQLVEDHARIGQDRPLAQRRQTPSSRRTGNRRPAAVSRRSVRRFRRRLV